MNAALSLINGTTSHVARWAEVITICLFAPSLGLLRSLQLYDELFLAVSPSSYSHVRDFPKGSCYLGRYRCSKYAPTLKSPSRRPA